MSTITYTSCCGQGSRQNAFT